jgi:hypothetical protein
LLEEILHNVVIYYATSLLIPFYTIEKTIFAQLVKKLPIFYGTRRFITVFTRAAILPYPEADRDCNDSGELSIMYEAKLYRPS